jgi:hypothetical protein
MGGKKQGNKDSLTRYYCLQAKHVGNLHLLSAIRTEWYTYIYVVYTI